MAEIGTDIAKAAALLDQGELVAIPTETVYGLAANALNPEAVASIFAAKNRPFFDPLIVHISSIGEVEKYASAFPEKAQRLCALLWPGPLTIVLPKKPNVPDIVTAGQGSVALRVPQHPMALDLLQRIPFPLAAPSANPFGYVSPTSAEHVNNGLGNAISYILDGGKCKVGIESTIVEFQGETAKVLRLGGASPEMLASVLGEFEEELHQNSNPTAPGQLDKHYSPKSKFVLEGIEEWDMKTIKTARLRFKSFLSDLPIEHQYILSENGDMNEAAAHLFGMMRDLDNKSYGLIIAELLPEQGLGRAINDRLRRAAAQ